MDNIALASITPQRAAQVAFMAVDTIQGLRPEEQAAGMALLFVMLTRRFKTDPRALLAQADRRLVDALTPRANEKPGDIVRALRQYLREEL
jgi:hypothetical protein